MNEDATLNPALLDHLPLPPANNAQVNEFTQLVDQTLGRHRRKKRQQDKIREQLIRGYIDVNPVVNIGFKGKILDLLGRT